MVVRPAAKNYPTLGVALTPRGAIGHLAPPAMVTGHLGSTDRTRSHGRDPPAGTDRGGRAWPARRGARLRRRPAAPAARAAGAHAGPSGVQGPARRVALGRRSSPLLADDARGLRLAAAPRARPPGNGQPAADRDPRRPGPPARAGAGRPGVVRRRGAALLRPARGRGAGRAGRGAA